MGRRRWINYGSQNLRKDTVVSSPGFLSASCIPGLELKKPATERNAERWRQNNSDNNSSSSNETQLKQKEKSALSNVRIKNDKTEKVLCMTALLQPSNLDRKKKKKKGLWPARPLAAPPPAPAPPSQRTSSGESRIPRFTGGNRSHLPLFTTSLEIKHMEILELYLHLAVRWQSSPSLLG